MEQSNMQEIASAELAKEAISIGSTYKKYNSKNELSEVKFQLANLFGVGFSVYDQRSLLERLLGRKKKDALESFARETLEKRLTEIIPYQHNDDSILRQIQELKEIKNGTPQNPEIHIEIREDGSRSYYAHFFVRENLDYTEQFSAEIKKAGEFVDVNYSFRTVHHDAFDRKEYADKKHELYSKMETAHKNVLRTLKDRIKYSFATHGMETAHLTFPIKEKTS